MRRGTPIPPKPTNQLTNQLTNACPCAHTNPPPAAARTATPTSLPAFAPPRAFTPPHLCHVRRDLNPEHLSHDGILDLILHHIVVVIVAQGVEALADLSDLSVTLEAAATLAGGTV